MDLREVAAGLERRREELAQELQRLTAPPVAGQNLSFGKRIGDGTTEAVERISTTLAARSISATLADVDRALEKIAEGSYGVCESCGREISAERLEAMPQTLSCIDCAATRSSH
jgi:DnaK suppressor protein